MGQNLPSPSDRLSSLPDGILGDIVSLLPTKTAVTTSVLSHRWRFLWTQPTSLHLDSHHFPLQTSEFYTVVDQLLTHLTSLIIRTFSIRAPYPRQQHFDPWLRRLCSQNIETIDISFYWPSSLDDAIKNSPFTLTLPSCIFLTQSLVCLNLPSHGLDYIFPDGDDTHLVIKLPNLKKLSLRLKLRASQCGFVTKLVRSCPLLEDLNLTGADSWFKKGRNEDDGAVIDISCPNLKHLKLIFLSMTGNAKVVIDAPKLVCFALDALSLASCTFVKKPITLCEALIDIYSQAKDLVLSLLPGISDVTVLEIPGNSLGMFEGCKDYLENSLIFSNLTELRLQFSASICGCLNHFSFEFTSLSLLLRIKIIKIRIHKVKHKNIFKKLAEYLLSNAPSLEKLTFLVNPLSSQTEEMLGIDLDLFSRKFPQCLIEISGLYARV